jgi:hypothetical protein
LDEDLVSDSANRKSPRENLRILDGLDGAVRLRAGHWRWHIIRDDGTFRGLRSSQRRQF